MIARMTVLCAILAAAGCGSGQRDEKPVVSGVVVYRKKLPDNREIVVVRGPGMDATAMRGLLAPQTLAETMEMYPVRLEVRSGTAPPFVVGTRLLRLSSIEQFSGFDTLDVLVDPNRIVVATAEFGGIRLWRFDLLESSVALADLEFGDWTNVAAPVPLDRQIVRVVLGHSRDGKGITAEVTDLRPDLPRPIVFEQVGDEWKFETKHKMPPLFPEQGK